MLLKPPVVAYNILFSISMLNQNQRYDIYDGEHRTARFSVSTGVKKENSMRIKANKNIKRIIEVYHSKYFIAKFAFK